MLTGGGWPKVRGIESKKLLLVVDDEPANLRFANSILRDEYDICLAPSGATALNVIQSAVIPDLILLDVSMPGMDGYDVCRALKASPQTRDIPIIFLTGQTRDEDETEGFEAGAVDYIHKPFSAAVLKARVRTHIMLREANELLSRQLLAINSELEMAREIQLSILPSDTPKLKGLDFAARYFPMSAVAGDFYDFIFVDEKHVGILIADVSGHGLAAALIASMLKFAFAAQAPHAFDPALVLSGLNQSLYGKFDRHFVTAGYVFLDLEKNILSYAGAGHPPLLLWCEREGRVRQFEQNGLFLGPFAKSMYSSIQSPIETGDRLFLYTDGILEFRNRAEEEFGGDRLKELIELNHGLNTAHHLQALVDQMWRWAEHTADQAQSDDLTLLAISIMKH
jgi:sigma-B regulation protein RsbU (phosphoserine phosphatase)